MNKYFKYLVIIQVLTISFKALGQNSLSNEKIYLQTDRDIYIAGEDVFFKSICYKQKSTSEEKLSKYAYLALRNESNVIVSGLCLKLENNTFSGSFSLPDTLSTGRYQLVSYTNTMRNFAESNYFKKEIIVANRFDNELFRVYAPSLQSDSSSRNREREGYNSQNDVVSIASEKVHYAKREKIKIALTALGLKGNESAQLTVSVREKTYQQDQDYTNALNLSNKRVCYHFPEINSVILEGQVISTENKQPLRNILVYLSTPDSISNLQWARSNKEGMFFFQLNDYYNFKNLIINLPDNPSAQIILDNKYSLTEPFKPSRFFSDSLLKDYIVKSQGIVQVQKDYKSLAVKDLPDTFLGNNKPPLLYPPVTNAIYPSDFVALPDFVEISREILPYVRTRKKGLGYETKLLNFNQSDFFNQNPMILLDGVPINSINQVISLGTEKINKVEILPFQRYYGGEFFAGILALFSKDMEINNIAWQTPMSIVNYVQLQPRSVFERPSYSKQDKIPDFRQLLYWNPNLLLTSNEKASIEFLASDNKGEFEICVDGIAPDGRIIKSRATINIGTNFK